MKRLTIKDMIAELTWEYDLTDEEALRVIHKYAEQGRYDELNDTVLHRRTKPDYIHDEEETV